MASTPELEDIFLMNPDMIPQLKRKQQIMMDHLWDANETYVRFN